MPYKYNIKYELFKPIFTSVLKFQARKSGRYKKSLRVWTDERITRITATIMSAIKSITTRDVITR
jgi:hypothetical protein